MLKTLHSGLKIEVTSTRLFCLSMAQHGPSAVQGQRRRPLRSRAYLYTLSKPCTTSTRFQILSQGELFIPEHRHETNQCQQEACMLLLTGLWCYALQAVQDERGRIALGGGGDMDISAKL